MTILFIITLEDKTVEKNWIKALEKDTGEKPYNN